MNIEKTREILKMVRPDSIISILQQGIEMEKLALQAADVTGNDEEYTYISNRLADARIFLLILTGEIRNE